MTEAALPLAFSLLLAVISIFSDKAVKHFEKFHEELMSFSAGILITIILVEFMGVVSSGALLFGQFIYVYVVLGFVVFHSIEKYVYKHVPSSKIKEIRKELGMIHFAGFTVEHVILGMFLTMVWFFRSLDVLYILVVPFIIRTIASSHPIKHLGMKTFGLWVTLVTAFAIPFGSLFALSLLGFQSALYSIFAFITGTSLYLVVMDIIPKYRKGNIYWFFIGFLITAGIQLALV